MSDLSRSIRLLGGAAGTDLQQTVPSGICPSLFFLESEELLCPMLREYAAAADVLLAPTGCANTALLSRYQAEERMVEINTRLMQSARSCAGGKPVGGVLSRTGLTLRPFGKATMDALFAIYIEQARALAAAGADFFFIDGLESLGEARAAVLACTEASDIPVYVTLRLDEELRTPQDNAALCCLAVLQSMGASAVGFCGDFDEQAVSALSEMLYRYARVPLILQPPLSESDPDRAGTLASAALAGGFSMLAGGSGSRPIHMPCMRRAIDAFDPALHPLPERDTESIIAATEREALFIDPTLDISEPVDITENLAEDILAAEDITSSALKIVLTDAEQVETFIRNSYMIEMPLCIDATDVSLFERLAMEYHGRALFDHTGELDSEELAGIMDRYGIIIL